MGSLLTQDMGEAMGCVALLSEEPSSAIVLRGQSTRQGSSTFSAMWEDCVQLSSPTAGCWWWQEFPRAAPDPFVVSPHPLC